MDALYLHTMRIEIWWEQKKTIVSGANTKYTRPMNHSAHSYWFRFSVPPT